MLILGIWTYNDSTNKSQIKKKVQCSAHSINDSGIYDTQSMQTRSCGTNVVHASNVHQRSRSALVETINAATNQDRLLMQVQHQRSKSWFMQNRNEQCDTPPAPPPKMGKMKRPTEESNYASPPSMLMQLAAFSPDLLESLNATTTTSISSLETTPQVTEI